MIRLQLSSNLPRGVRATRLRSAARAAYKATGFTTNLTIELAFVAARQSKQLNGQYAGPKHAYATDVLSFAYGSKHVTKLTTKPVETGDIAICTSIARAQAKEHGQTLEAEICLLLTHGVLHILGFDHRSKMGRASFEKLQDAIMKELKIPTRKFFND